MATQSSEDYVNGRVAVTTYTDDTGIQITSVNTYTISTYDYSRPPVKPVTITDTLWWDKAHQGQESSLVPTHFADSYFKLRSFYEPTPSRPVTLGANTLSRLVFNKLSLY